MCWLVAAAAAAAVRGRVADRAAHAPPASRRTPASRRVSVPVLMHRMATRIYAETSFSATIAACFARRDRESISFG